MAPALPGALGVVTDQAHVHLMNQPGGIERLARRLVRQPLCRQPAQLRVDQRQELFGGLPVAWSDRIDDLRELTHNSKCFPPGATADVD